MLIYFIKRLQRLFTTGIIDNIQKYFQYKRHQSSQYKEVEVDIQDAFQIFTLLFLGLLLSIGLLIFERIYHEKYKKKCENIQTRQMKKIDEKFSTFENEFGKHVTGKLFNLISCTEFGLTETEILEILMPTNDITDFVKLENGHLNFSTLAAAKCVLGKFFFIFYFSGGREGRGLRTCEFLQIFSFCLFQAI